MGMEYTSNEVHQLICNGEKSEVCYEICLLYTMNWFDNESCKES
jgi:hypothetical protein